MPERIQRRRTKGWRMPPDAIYIGRPSRWSNPYRIGTCMVPDAQAAVDAFAANLPMSLDLSELRGKTLVCWCRVGSPCHGDILLRLANTPPGTSEAADAAGAARG